MSDNEQMNDVVKGLKDIRELAEKAGSESAEVKSQIANISEETSKKLAEVQAKDLEKEAQLKKLESEVEMVKKDYEDLYKKANRQGVPESGMDEFAQTYSKYQKEFAKYLREGINPSSEAIKEVADSLVRKSYDTDNETLLEHAAYDMIKEQSDKKGFNIYSLKTMYTGNNPSGGYFVQPDMRSDITVGRIFETSPMRAVSQIITTGTNEVEILIDDNESTTGGWVGEVQSRSDTATPEIGELRIAVHEQFAQPKVTQKMLDDSAINIEAWLSRKTDDILTRTENTAFVNGDGASKPKGFLSYGAWAVNGTYERNKLEQINSGTAGAVTADGLRNLQGALLEAYQPRAVFMCKRDTFTAISLLKDGAGRYLLNERMLPDGVDIRLLGKPLFFADDMQAIANDALAIAYGDFGVGYTIVDRMGLRVLRDNLTDKPYTKFYTTKRVGGAVTNYQAIKIQKLAA